MLHHFDDLRGPASPNFAIDALDQVQPAAYQLPSPALIAKTMVPEGLPGERRVRLCCVSHEASSSVSVHGKQEWYEQMVCVPECFVGLLSDLLMRCRVDEHHAQEHDMPCNSACLRVMDLNRCFGPDLVPLDVEEATQLSVSPT